MKIALGSDHRGVEEVKALTVHLKAAGHSVTVLGDTSGEPSDYPDTAWLVGNAVGGGKAERGILVCGSGIGISIAANKIRGVRAALAHDALTAAVSRNHNDSNVLCLSAEETSANEALQIVDAWLDAPFEGGRHERRVKKIMAIERGEDPTKITEPAKV